MIRSATTSDCEPIAKQLWDIWHHLKARQIASPLHAYTSSETIAAEISRDLSRWFVCEIAGSEQLGFFGIRSLADQRAYKRWRFPESGICIDHFACLLPGEVLLEQFRALAVHVPDQSVLMSPSTSLRDVYWAALKAGFRLLGESRSIVGTFAWLYLDREERFDEIQTKLQRAKIVIAEPGAARNSRRAGRLTSL
jgi:hypothetical protein